MKVIVVDPGNYTPYYNYSLCKALGENGCEVQWVTTRFIYDQISTAGLDVRYGFGRLLNLSSRCRSLFRRLSAVRRVTRAAEYPFDWVSLLWAQLAESPDVLHLQWGLLPPVDWVMIHCLKRIGVPVVHTAHNLLPHEEKFWHLHLYSLVYKVVNQIIVHTESDRAGLVQDYGLSANRIAVIPYGAPLDFCTPCEDIETARRHLGLRPERPTLLFFGLIRPYKGLTYLLDALPAVRRRFPEVTLLIAGPPKYDFTPYQERIEVRELEESVVMHLRYIPHTEWRAYFAAADMVILPYTKTYQSAVLFTAYAFGRPVIATEVGGLPEAVDEGRSGYIVPARDAGALAGAICEGLSDLVHLKAMGDYARQLVQTKYEWDEIARATIRVYQDLISQRG